MSDDSHKTVPHVRRQSQDCTPCQMTVTRLSQVLCVPSFSDRHCLQPWGGGELACHDVGVGTERLVCEVWCDCACVYANNSWLSLPEQLWAIGMPRPDEWVPSVCTHSSSGGGVRVHCNQQHTPGPVYLWNVVCVFCTSFHTCVLMPHWPAWHSGGRHADICLLHCMSSLVWQY